MSDLSRCVPFDGLPDASRAEIIGGAQRLSLAEGDYALSQDRLGTRAIFVILSGRIRLVELDQRGVIRHLQAGELFGHFTVLRDSPPPYQAQCTGQSQLLQIPKSVMEFQFSKHPVFAAWFRADLRRFERELGVFDDVAGSRFLFGQRLSDLEHSTPPVSCSKAVTVQDAARMMYARGSDYILITENNLTVGILTKSDLCDRVIARGLSVDRPVSHVMTRDPLTIRARSSVFEGMMTMERRGWRHLLLLDPGGEIQGVINDTDLARTLLASPAAMRQRIGQSRCGEDLRRLRRRADQTIVTLYRRAVRGDDILQINTRFNDALTAQAITLAHNELPSPPPNLQWCWLSLGSEGRGEMGLRTDQDNAIIYRSTNVQAADRWLRDLAEKCNALLAEAGIKLCDGGIMASLAPMRCTIEGWSAAMDQWMGDSDDVRLLWAAALCDSRPVVGDEMLHDELKSALTKSIKRQRGFLPALARESLAIPLPLRTFPTMRLRGSGSRRNATLDVKRQGSQLMTNAARLFCLDAGWLDKTNTGARLSYLAENDPELRATMNEAMVAADMLTDLRLSWHVEQVDRNEKLTDIMPLSQLGDTRQQLLLSAYQAMDGIRFRIRNQFGLSG